MDKHFLEFWGNFLLNAAQGQKQLENMAAWTQQGFKGFGDMTALFQKIYGLDHIADGTPACLKTWKKAEEDFKQSFDVYLSLLGVVPKSEHLELIRKYEDLKEKISSQEETIKHLRMLLMEAKLKDQGEVVEQFDGLIKKQTDQFQKMMDYFSRAFTKDSSEQEAGQ